MSTSRDSEERLREATRRILDARVEQLDAAVVERLAAIRQEALAGGSRNTAGRWWAGAGLAFAAVLGVAVWLGPMPEGAQTPVAPQAASDLDLLLAEDDPDLYENLEFYFWLEEQDAPAG